MAGQKAVLGTLLQSSHYEKLIQELRCGGCTHYMAPPIMLCESGHSVCSGCHKKLVFCPICSREMTSMRSVVLESIASSMLFPCSNKGCPKRATLEAHRRHAKICDHRIINCFMTRVYGNCEWSGKAGEWLDHCYDIHKDKVSDLPFLNVQDKWNPKTRDAVINYYLMKCYESVFNVYQIYDKKGGRMMWTVLWSEGNGDHDSFYYEVDIFIPDNPTKKIVFRRPCKTESDADFLEYTQNAYLPIDSVFSMLDKDENINFTIRIGEIENLTSTLIQPAESTHTLILLQDTPKATEVETDQKKIDLE